jgi:hypothetical protein
MDANEVICASIFQFRDTNNVPNIYRFFRLAGWIATAAVGGIDELEEWDRTAEVECGGVDRIVEANMSNITVLGRLEPHPALSLVIISTLGTTVPYESLMTVVVSTLVQQVMVTSVFGLR